MAKFKPIPPASTPQANPPRLALPVTAVGPVAAVPVAMAIAGNLTFNGGGQVMPLTTVDYDPGGLVDTANNWIKVKQAGRYLVIASFNTNPQGALSLAFLVNGSVQRYGNYQISGVILQSSVILRLAAGDQVQAQVSAPNLQTLTTGADRSYLHVIYLG